MIAAIIVAGIIAGTATAMAIIAAAGMAATMAVVTTAGGGRFEDNFATSSKMRR